MENETKQEMEKVETPGNNEASVPVETAEPQVDKNAPAPKINIDKFRISTFSISFFVSFSIINLLLCPL